MDYLARTRVLLHQKPMKKIGLPWKCEVLHFHYRLLHPFMICLFYGNEILESERRRNFWPTLTFVYEFSRWLNPVWMVTIST